MCFDTNEIAEGIKPEYTFNQLANAPSLSFLADPPPEFFALDAVLPRVADLSTSEPERREREHVALKNTSASALGATTWFHPWTADVDAVCAVAGRPLGSRKRTAARVRFPWHREVSRGYHEHACDQQKLELRSWDPRSSRGSSRSIRGVALAHVEIRASDGAPQASAIGGTPIRDVHLARR